MSDDRISRMEGKLDAIANTASSIDKQLAINTLILDEHHKRTTLLEKRMQPIEDHVKFLRKLSQVILTLGGVAGAVLTIMEFLK